MKKLIYSLLTLAAALSLASCQPDKLLGGNDGGDAATVDASFTVTLGPATKAFAEGTQANQLYAGLYKVVSGGYEYVASTKVEVNGGKGQVTFTKGLRRGENYKVVFWAQHEADGFTSPYTVALDSATPTITVATTGDANDDLRDAFYGVYETGEVTAAITIADGVDAIKLKRPFAQINILVPGTNIDNVSPTIRTSSMTVADAPNVLNLVTGAASGSETYTFNDAAVSEPAFGTFANNGYQYMAMNYVLPAQDGNGNYAVTFSVTNDSQVVTNKQVTLPLKPNVRTNIVGNIFDENFDFSAWAVIKPEIGELTTINLNVGTAGESSQNPVTLAGAGATASVTPIFSRDVTGETPTITVNPSTVADAEWVPAVAADPNAVPPVEAVPAHIKITAKDNGPATVTVVFPAVTKTDYAEGRFTFYIEVTGVSAPSQLATPVLSAQNAIADANSIMLDWDDVENATSYAVTYKVKDAAGDATTVTPAPTASEVTITGLNSGTFYTITVQALADGYTASEIAQIDVITEAASVPQKTLESISIAGYTTDYTVGDPFNFDGTVTATYSDQSIANVTTSATVSVEPDMTVVANNVAFTISYTEDGVTKTANGAINVAAAPSPTQLVMSTITCSAQTSNTLTFTWTAVEHATGYKVSTDGGNTYGDPINALTYTWEGLNASTEYTLNVKAIGDGQNYTDSEAGYTAGTTTASTPTWTLVTSAASLAVGDVIIIANADGDKALSTTQNSANRGGVDFDHSSVGEAVQRITLAAGSVDNSFALVVGEGSYLYAASSSANQLKTTETLNANASWTISISNSLSTITAQGTSSRKLMRFNPNNGSPIFACYATDSSTGSLVKIYKLTQ